MPYTYSQDKSIYYRVEGSGQSLLLISPIGNDTAVWDNLISILRSNYQVIRLDYRGSGLSDKPFESCTHEELVEDVISVLKSANVEKVHVVGHDLGGMIAQHLAHDYPSMVLSMTLASTWGKLGKDATNYFQEQLQLAETDPNKVEVIEHQHMLGIPSQPLHSFIRQAEYCLEHDATGFLSSVEVPSLVISGTEDEIVPPKVNYGLTSELPNARSHFIEDAGHMLQLEAPEEFAMEIIKFCRAV